MQNLELWKTVIEMVAAISALGVSIVSLIAMYIVMRDRAERKKLEDDNE